MRLELKRFADYWDKASPGNVDEIVFTPIKEPATRVAALLAGDVDFIAPVPPTDLARVKADPCCTLITMPSTRVLTFELNQAARSPPSRTRACGSPSTTPSTAKASPRRSCAASRPPRAS